MKNKQIKKIFIVFYLLIFICPTVYSQVELVPVTHKVYLFLNTLHKKGIIQNYNNANLPLSRRAVADFLNSIEKSKNKLTSTEKNVLNDLQVEFSYDLNKNLEKSSLFLPGFNFNHIFNDDKQKYLYAFNDDNFSLFLDGTFFISHRIFNAQSFDKTSLTIDELGVRLRGTLYDNLGFYLRAGNGQQINGNRYARTIAAKYDPKLHSTLKFISEKYFDSFEGYLRYETENRAVALTLGREGINFGTGYIDKLFISSNSVPFDYGKIDIAYKGIKYSFFYGNIRGDSLGVVLQSKNFIAHRLDISFSDKLKFGIYEGIIVSNRPLSFTYMNPVSFLFSADLTAQSDNSSNSLIGLDMEILPFENIGFQTSFLIDDYDFKYLGKSDPYSNNNKFAWQFGLMNTDFLGVGDLTAAIEYTHLDPFVYTHKSDKSQYTNWGLSLGHALPPNADEIALKFDYWFTSRLRTSLKFQFQRTASRLVFDQAGNLIENFGGNIERGDNMYWAKVRFLDGDRVNNTIVTLKILFEPIRQYFVDIEYSGWLIDKKFVSKKYTNQFIYLTVSTDF